MTVMMIMSIFWTLYGIAGVLGFQNIPAKYRGYIWTKDYIRYKGISWLMMGIPWLVLCLLILFCFEDRNIRVGIVVLFVIVLAIPSIIYTIVWEKKYKTLLEKEACI